MNNRRKFITISLMVSFVIIIFVIITIYGNAKSGEINTDAEHTTTIVALNPGTTTEYECVPGAPIHTETGIPFQTGSDIDVVTNPSKYIDVTTDIPSSERETSVTAGEQITSLPAESGSWHGDSQTSTVGNVTTSGDNTTTTGGSVTTSGVSTVPSTSVNTGDSSTEIQFEFIKYNIDKKDSHYDWYTFLTGKGYKPIDNITQLSEYAKSKIDALANQKDVHYIITDLGKFDEIASQMQTLISTSQKTGNPIDIYAAETYLYDKLGLDYSYYYVRGIGTFKIKKVQDVVNDICSNSVYAIYYYSYETAEMAQITDNNVTQIINYINSKLGDNASDYEKVKAVHMYLCGLVTYDNNPTTESHTAYGALVDRKAVCEGYAKAYKLLLNKLGISCEIVINKEHAWNEVYIDGKWYFCDTTNDSVNECFAYFLLGKDVLMSTVNKTVDGYLFDATENIASYNYIDGLNTSRHELSDRTWDYESRLQ